MQSPFQSPIHQQEVSLLALVSLPSPSTSLLLALLFAFAKRVRNSIRSLQAFVIVNAVVLIAGSLLLDHPFQAPSLLEALEIARFWTEAVVCIALALVLRRHESKSWFARVDLSHTSIERTCPGKPGHVSHLKP